MFCMRPLNGLWYDCLKNKGMILDCPHTRDNLLHNILEPVLWNQSHSFYEDSLQIPLTTLNTRRKNFDLLEYFRPTHPIFQRPKIFEEISKNHPSKSLQLPSSHLLQWLAILKAQTILASTSRSPFCSWTLSYRGIVKLSMYASSKPWWNDV